MFDDFLSSSEDEEDIGGNATFLDALHEDVGNEFLFAQRVQNVLDEEFYEWDDVWNEEPFDDGGEDLNKENPMWEGVPQCCADMSSKFQRGDEPLFDGSKHKGKDLARFVLGLKCKHFKMGDTAVAGIMGMLASFLPEGTLMYASIKCIHMRFARVKCCILLGIAGNCGVVICYVNYWDLLCWELLGIAHFITFNR